MSYTKKTWAAGQKVKSADLNNMETGIANAEPFVVTITVNGSTKTADYSSSEIKTIAESGREVLTFYDNKIYRFALYSSPNAYFSSINGTSSYRLYINNSKAVTVSEFSLYVKPSSGIPETDLAQAVKDKLTTYTVTFTPTAPDYSGTMDHTANEITTAYTAGKRIVASVPSMNFIAEMTVATTHTDLPNSFDFIALGELSEQDIMLRITTGFASSSDNTYTVKIYPLTPMS